MRIRPTHATAVTALVAVSACASDSSASSGDDAAWLFVQNAQSASISAVDDGHVIVLENVSKQTTGFTDRPARDTSVIGTSVFVSEWDAMFGEVAPNAALNVPGGTDETIAVTIHDVQFDRVTGSVAYTVTLLDSDLTVSSGDLGPVSLFIDDAAAFPSNNTVRVTTTSETILSSAVSNGDSVRFQYSAMPGSDPSISESTIAVWSGENADVSAPPISDEPVAVNTSAGMLEINGMPNAPYTIAYLTGPNPGTAAATLTVKADGTQTADFIDLSHVRMMPGGVTVSYHTPTGLTPATSGHWVGLFQSNSVSSYSRPEARTSLTTSSDGSVTIDASLQRFTTYTLAYFTGPNQTDIAATATFSTS